MIGIHCSEKATRCWLVRWGWIVANKRGKVILNDYQTFVYCQDLGRKNILCSCSTGCSNFQLVLRLRQFYAQFTVQKVESMMDVSYNVPGLYTHNRPTALMQQTWPAPRPSLST